MKKMPASAALLAACLALGGCFGGLKSGAPVPVNYRISAPKLATGAPLESDLLVSVEATAPGSTAPASPPASPVRGSTTSPARAGPCGRPRSSNQR